METTQTITKVATALLAAQKEMGSAKKGAVNPFFKSKYADLGSVMEACKDALNNHGISVLQPIGITENGGEYVETILLHESGEYLVSKMKLAVAKAADPQSQGKAISYARRYALQSMVFIPAEDDDAQSATRKYTETIH